MEHKQERPYIQIIIEINNITFAIPFRSQINHPNCFLTDKENKCGVDYSKAVVILKEEYLELKQIPIIRQKEFDFLKGKEKLIENGLYKYIKKYKKCKLNNNAYSNQLCKFSTLQYFENIINILEVTYS